MSRKLAALLVTVGALGVAVPTLAQADKGGHPHKGSHGTTTMTTTTPTTTTPTTATTTTPTTTTPSHRCQPNNRGYVESGTVDATTTSTLAKGTNGTWSGTVVADITKANRWASANKGKTVTYTFAGATLSVRLPRNTTGLTAGERVRLIGKIATVGKKCPPPSTAPAPVFTRVIVHRAAA